MRHKSPCIGYAVLLVVTLSLAAAAQDSLSVQLPPKYWKWLNEDVHWIIEAQERTTFLALKSDGARDRFITTFWEQRNPTPGGLQNPFKQEHYRRLAFASQHFTENRPGWKTDRGRIYVVYGPPDSIAKHAASATAAEDEVWFYREIKGGGENVSWRFIDECRCGEFRIKTKLPNTEWEN